MLLEGRGTRTVVVMVASVDYPSLELVQHIDRDGRHEPNPMPGIHGLHARPL